MQLSGYGLQRRPIPRTPVNKGPGLQKSSALDVDDAAIVPLCGPVATPLPQLLFDWLLAPCLP